MLMYIEAALIICVLTQHTFTDIVASAAKLISCFSYLHRGKFSAAVCTRKKNTTLTHGIHYIGDRKFDQGTHALTINTTDQSNVLCNMSICR